MKACFSRFLNYAVGTRESLSSRLDVLMTEGESVSMMFGEDPKKVSSAKIYGKIMKIVDAIENAHSANANAATLRPSA